MCRGETGYQPVLVLGQADVEAVGMADVQSATVAVEHVDPETHYLGLKKEGQPFDRLREAE
jgi:hypothetical protein